MKCIKICAIWNSHLSYFGCIVKRRLKYQAVCLARVNYFYVLFQLVETDDPGTFKVWAIVGSDLHSLKVNIPRIFYVNCHTPKEGAGTSKSGLKGLLVSKFFTNIK